MPTSFTFREVTDGIWQIGTPLGQIYVFIYLVDTGDGLLLYDTGLKSSARAVLQQLESLERSPEALQTIVISHSHHDHIGANAEIAESCNARLLADARARDWMIDHERQFLEFFGKYRGIIDLPADLADFFFDNLGRPWVADIWLSEYPHRLETARPMEIVHTPGHSTDGISLWLPESRVLICGDAFMGTGAGGGLPQYSDAAAYRETLAQMQALQPELLLSGHFEVIAGKTAIELALRQSLQLQQQIDDFVQHALRLAKQGYRLGTLAHMACARFGRPLTPQALITIEAHLHWQQSRQLAHEADTGIWRAGKADKRWLPVMPHKE